jgi:putative colanic acid biosynthesis UDP-glucose lipid carrier transferase
MILRFRNFTRSVMFLLDLVLISGSAFVIRSTMGGSEGAGREALLAHVALFNLVWILLVIIRDPYPPVTFVNVSKATLRHILTHFLVLNTLVFLMYSDLVSREMLLMHYAVVTSAVFLMRLGFLVLYREFGLFRRDKRRAVIIGNGEVSYKAARYLARPDSGYDFIGVFNDAPDPGGRLPLLGKKEDCIDYCIRNDVREIFSTVMPESGEHFRQMIHRAEDACIRVKYLPDFKTIFAREVNLSMENELLIIRFRDEKLERIENRIVKRGFDLLFTALVTLTVLWWLIPILTLAVRLSSRGPVFFVQKRSGRDGKVFDCYKFRTMRVNDEADVRAARPDDDRLTPLGALLRRTSLDELPQFLNVLKGEMSVVGPRPHMLMHTEAYRRLINRYMVRHFLKPGITGWAQTNGCRGDLTGNRMEERLRKDIWYMENWSFLLDVQIILKTVRLILAGDRNAY